MRRQDVDGPQRHDLDVGTSACVFHSSWRPALCTTAPVSTRVLADSPRVDDAPDLGVATTALDLRRYVEAEPGSGWERDGWAFSYLQSYKGHSGQKGVSYIPKPSHISLFTCIHYDQ